MCVLVAVFPKFYCPVRLSFILMRPVDALNAAAYIYSLYRNRLGIEHLLIDQSGLAAKGAPLQPDHAWSVNCNRQ